MKEYLSKLRKFIECGVRKHPIYYMIIKGALTVSPSAILGYTKISFNKDLHLPGGEAIVSLLSERFYIVGLILFLPAVIAVLFSILEYWLKDPSEATSAELYSLLKRIDSVVGRKLERFSRYAQNMRSKSKSEAFNAITQPQKQLQELINSLFYTLLPILGDESLEIVLTEIKGNLPIGYPCCMPGDAAPSEKLLDKSVSGLTLFAKTAKLQSPITLQNIQKHLKETVNNKEKRLFLDLNEGASNKNIGSISCFPIYHTHQRRVVYCISVKSITPGLIANEFPSRYGYIIDCYKKRILIEYNLKHIKDHAK